MPDKGKGRAWWPVRKFMNLQLAQKMILLYVFIVLLPIIAFGGVYIGRILSELGRQYVADKAFLLEQASQSLQNNLIYLEHCNAAFQSNGSIRDYVENYDLSDSDGVYLYLTDVKSVFGMLRGNNDFIRDIHIYRKRDYPMNDPYNVRNKKDSPYLGLLEGEPSTSGMSLLLDLSGSGEYGVVLKKLYNDKYYREIGVTEIVFDADYMFDPLRFVGEDEYLILSVGNTRYRLRSTGGEGVEGKAVQLEPFAGEVEECENVASAEFASIGTKIDYHYPNLHGYFSETLVYGCLMLAVVLGVFSLIYYLIYLSITQRVIGLTRHIAAMAPNEPTPYNTRSYTDEIGDLMARFNDMTRQIDYLINEQYRNEQLVNQAQYYAMESQITPHFLYNTLESIHMLIELEEYEKASQSITILGNLFRYNVSWKHETASIQDEVEHIRDYLTLYTYRMGKRFRYDIQVAEDCLQVKCPYCILQPIVENCFKHGFKNRTGKLYISIKGCREGDKVLLDIFNNGDQIPQANLLQLRDRLKTPASGQDGSSVGLQNVHDRLRLLYGKDCGITVMNAGEEGCIVRITIGILASAEGFSENKEGHQR